MTAQTRQNPPTNPPWSEDHTVGQALVTAAEFIGSEKTLEHTLRNLRSDRRVIYTVEFQKRANGTVRMDLLVNAANAFVSRKNLTLDDSAPTPADTLSAERD